MYPFQYSKVISAIISTAVLVGLQSVMTATPVRSQTTCHLEPRAADLPGLWPQIAAAGGEGCSVRASKALARNQAALRGADAEVDGGSAHAEVREALQEQRPIAAHCIAGPRRPLRRGAWQHAIDRTTGHRCWRLVGAIGSHARISSRARSSRVPNSSALSPRVAAARAGPVIAPASVEARRLSQPSEVLTGSVARPSEIPRIDLGQSLASAAGGVISNPGEVNLGALPPLDPRFAWTANRSLSGKSAVLVAIDVNPAKTSSRNMFEDVLAFMPVRGRPAVFLIVFLSVLATISALYALVIGSLKLLRSRSRRKSAPDPRDTMGAISWRHSREQDD